MKTFMAAMVIGLIMGYSLRNGAAVRAARQRVPTFNEGVEYGLLYAARHPQEENLPALTEGARNLWRVLEVEHGSNQLSAAYRKAYPPTTFDQGVERGFEAMNFAINGGLHKVTVDQIKTAAWILQARALLKDADDKITILDSELRAVNTNGNEGTKGTNVSGTPGETNANQRRSAETPLRTNAAPL